jgi:hypothetical protein
MDERRRLGGLVVRGFDGGDLGFFLCNALGDEDAERTIISIGERER